MMSGPAIHFDKVGVQLGGLDILDDVSFTVQPGTVHCIVGPNGGGKTTLMKALLGLIRFTGAIRLDGPANPVVGYAPQSIELDRHLPLTVLDVMAVMNQRRPAFAGRAPQRRLAQDAALERLGLTSRRNRLFGQISGGERQRLLVAQALVPPPDLLLMDEPTSNMDAAGSRLVEDLARELAAGGATVIWVNHDWNQVRRVADAVTEISRTLVGTGRPAEVLPVHHLEVVR